MTTTRFLLPALSALLLASCAPTMKGSDSMMSKDPSTMKDGAMKEGEGMMAKDDQAMLAKSDSMMADHMMKGSGLISLPSTFSVAQTLDKVAVAAQALNFAVVARIDHAGAAQKAGLTLRPTEVLLVGNPAGGTPLMQCAQSVGIDLPMKFLAHQDEAGKVFLTYNDPAYLQARHGAKGCDEAFQKASGALKMIAENALKP